MTHSDRPTDPLSPPPRDLILARLAQIAREKAYLRGLLRLGREFEHEQTSVRRDPSTTPEGGRRAS